MIKRLSPALLDYVHSFDLTALAIYRDGRIGITRDPAGATSAWWCEAAKAGTVLKVAQRHGVEAAVRGLVEHKVIVASVTAAVAKLDERMHWAQQTGALAAFNTGVPQAADRGGGERQAFHEL